MGGRISETTLREIRDRADIVEVVSETVSLSRSGANFRGLCPFHREKTPSFFVHPARQVFRCYGCGEGGSVFHFLMKARNLSFVEAVEELGDRYGIALKYESGGASRRPDEDLYGILRSAADAYRDLLRSSAAGRAARDLLRARGVTPEAEQEFFLGYGGGGRDLLSALKAGGIDPARAEKAGLLIRGEGGGWRERFRGRLLFPITDARGRICGFGGRAIGDAQPKYLNSPESEVYRKSSVLYGLFQAFPAIRQEGRVVVVEGYMDLIGLWQRGVRNVVATCGTSLTDRHARTLKRLAETVILFFDGDAAGKTSAVRAGGVLYAEGVSPLILFPPRGKDPDDWAREASGEEIAEKIRDASPLMEYIERGTARKHDLGGIRGRLSYLKAMEKYLRWIPEAAERRIYAQRVARAAELPVETVVEQVWGREGGGRAAAPPAGMPGAGAPEENPEEALLLRLLASDPSLLADVIRDGVRELVGAPEIREAIERLRARAAEGRRADLPALLDEEIPEGLRRRLAGEILRADAPADEARRAYPEVVLALRKRKVRAELARLKSEMSGAAGDPDRERALFAEMVARSRELSNLERSRRSRG